jgi:hypothetical protein
MSWAAHRARPWQGGYRRSTLGCFPPRSTAWRRFDLSSSRSTKLKPLPVNGSRQEYLPRRFEVGAGLVAGGCSAVRTFPRVAAKIKTAIPAPRIFARRHAGADRDRADAHVTVIDVPAFFEGIERAAAAELRHGRYQSATAPREQ